jgi:hypothetical protein
MSDDPRQKKEEKSATHFQFGRTFIKKEDGIFQPETEERKQESQTHPATINVNSQIPVTIKRDWVGFIFVFIASVINAGTLVVVARYTFFAQVQSEQAIRSANAAMSAATTADATLKSSQQQFRTQQRPYIFQTPHEGFLEKTAMGIKPQIVNVLPDGRVVIGITLEIQNGGISPASNIIETKSEMFIGKPGEVVPHFHHFIPTYPNIESPSVLGFHLAQIVPSGEFKKLDSTQYQLVKDRKLAVYVLGAVRYTDVFQPPLSEPYETRYCVMFNPDGFPFADCGTTIK